MLPRITKMTQTTDIRCAKLLFAFLVFIALPAKAFAWGYEGHRIIAEVAEQFLEPTSVQQVRDLLAIENVTTLADVSTWADEVWQQHPETAPWHYCKCSDPSACE